MQGAHERFFEISRLMQGDRKGNSLMEDVLHACVDFSLLKIDAIPVPEQDRADRLNGLKVVLKRFNRYVSGRFSAFEEGLFQGADKDVSSWSDALTFQIMANRPN